jgi:hypothetical protein
MIFQSVLARGGGVTATLVCCERPYTAVLFSTMKIIISKKAMNISRYCYVYNQIYKVNNWPVCSQVIPLE